MTRAMLLLLVACSGSSPPARNGPQPGGGPKDTVPATTRPAGECDDAPLVTLDALAKGEHGNDRIALDVVPRAEITCTLLACDRECCNGCGGSYGAELGMELRVRFTNLPGECGGMDCNLHCEPFGVHPTTKYRFVGQSKYTPAGTESVYAKVEFAVEKYCLLP